MVATPIGNLGDITFRAVETLKNVDVVACEDTRRTLRLLTHFGIKKPLVSCRAHNESAAARKLLALLDEGKTAAYASDAGTPCVSDPGAVLADCVREGGHTITPIPGVSAWTALASAAGEIGKTVIFEGFLPLKGAKRDARLQSLMETGYAVALYESPFRAVKLLRAIADIDNMRRVVVGRELTKLHEEILQAPAKEAAEIFAGREKIMGEFSVLLAGVKKR
ncbi:MAG: 16S rRNA (cytidine(1402)-2'-O)-methyltransferase [Treponemataceae bacterium]|nr:MAG: 16S rRNA (cytidine(1402)-2'-O)-methyltransferase [Treponemataceae bacterium]